MQVRYITTSPVDGQDVNYSRPVVTDTVDRANRIYDVKKYKQRRRNSADCVYDTTDRSATCRLQGTLHRWSSNSQ